MLGCHLAKNTIPSLPEIVNGNGVNIYDINGNRYIDLSSQTCNLNLGHNHPVILNAVNKAMNKGIPYFISGRFKNSFFNELAEELVNLAPIESPKVNLRLCNGSDANEDAFKRTRKYHKENGRKIIVTQNESHHGQSSETMSASGKHFPKELYDYHGGSNNFFYIEPCNVYRKPKNISEDEYIEKCTDNLKNLVYNRKDIGGLMMELIQIDAGVVPQPKNYVKKVEEICKENDIIFMVDEVQTAFGWYGKIFASEYYGISPDVITIGKSLTAGFPSMAATIFNEKLDNLCNGESEHTHGGQIYPCIAALSNLDYLQNSGILDIVKEKSNHFMRHLEDFKNKYKQIGDIRNCELIFGIDFINKDGTDNDEAAYNTYNNAIKNNVFLIHLRKGRKKNVLLIKPPIIINHDEIEYSMNLLDKSLEESLR